MQTTSVGISGSYSIDYGYDPAGRLVSVIDRRDQQTTFEYDGNGRRTKTSLPNGVTETTAYDVRGFVVHETVASASETLADWTFSYDSVGRRVSETNAQGEVRSFAYDALGRLVRETRFDGTTTTFAYDAASNRIRSEDSQAGTTVYTYDASDRLVSETNGGRNDDAYL